ncbi:DUF1156 domain-containing protein [Bdellovibrionota bacterium FG-1]
MMAVEIRVPKKLIEVALPLDAINVAAAKEKSIRHGHPSTLHLWWARRPLAAARAIIFAQMVNDPGYERYLGRGVNKENAQRERERLFGIIEKLVKWENVDNESVLAEAREEIWKSWRETCVLNKAHPQAADLFNSECLPAFHDPFAGGGAIPLEAQRLGLESFASDLNPVAVTINKAMIEIPPRFSGSKPVAPRSEAQDQLILDWSGTRGLAEDLKRYGAIVRESAWKRIGNLYPPFEITAAVVKAQPDLKATVGEKLTVIAWIWARTAKCESPACLKVFPMLKSFSLSKRNGVHLESKIKGDKVSFTPVFGAKDEEVPGNVERRAVRCLFCDAITKLSAIEEQGRTSRLGQQLVAVIAEGKSGRVYLKPEVVRVPDVSKDLLEGSPSAAIEHWRSCTNCVVYGYTHFEHLFLDRQMAALNVFSKVVTETRSVVLKDALKAGLSNDGIALDQGGNGAEAYADAITIYLALSVSKLADRCSAFCGWDSSRDSMRNTFARQAIPMVWESSEANPFSESTGNFMNGVEWIVGCLEKFSVGRPGHVFRADAGDQEISKGKVISTDPPYYDNIPYSNLSDFFYIWLRKMLQPVSPDLFSTPVVPRATELVANKHRHGGKKEAEVFFLNGMQSVMKRLRKDAHPGFPVTIYYAFKQSDTDEESGTSSTGWETFLQALIVSGFSISGTWPIRTELSNRMLGSDSNALASSVVLVCNRRPEDAPVISRRDFIRELNLTLPEALEEMTTGGEHSPVAPVDLSQAIIGPGMGIYSKYSAVLEADGKPMSIKTALQLVNRFLAEDDFDHDTQFCLHWFENYGWDKGKFGEADVLARAKGTSVDGLREGGVAESSGGTLRLLKPVDLSEKWKPETDTRISVWEILHHLIRALNAAGALSAGDILAKTSRHSEATRTLAYRLYTLCERKGWAQDASQYNSLVLAWDAIEASARSSGYSGSQSSLFGEDQGGHVNSVEPIKRTRKKR